MYDMKNLTKLKKLGELAPDAFKGFVAFDEAAFKEGAIQDVGHNHEPVGGDARANLFSRHNRAPGLCSPCCDASEAAAPR